MNRRELLTGAAAVAALAATGPLASLVPQRRPSLRGIASAQGLGAHTIMIRVKGAHGHARLLAAPWSVNLDDGRWHHLAATISAEGEELVYVDGVVAAELEAELAYSMTIGKGTQVADLSVWSVKMSEAEIRKAVGFYYGEMVEPRDAVLEYWSLGEGRSVTVGA